MSLVTKLWFAILLVVLIAITGSVLISSYTSKQYFEEQLFAKNVDNANMLGLTLSSLEKSPVNIEMFIGSQFDIGHYASIRLIDPKGELIAEQLATRRLSSPIPSWFVALIEPQVEPGVAQVADGWNQYGALYVASDTSIAIEAMWSGTKRLVIGLFLVGAICGLVSSALMRAILRPLKGVVEQAQSLGEMQFVQLPIPSTLELRKVVQAMNGLSVKFKRILDNENQRLDMIRDKTHFDSETFLANREYFLSILSGQLNFRDTEGNNCLILLSVQDFKAHAVRLAPDLMGRFIAKLADTIKQTSQDQCLHYSDLRIGRLSEPDFAVLMTEVHALDKIVGDLDKAIRHVIASKHEFQGIQVNISAVQLQLDERAKDTIARADAGILAAIKKGDTKPTIIATVRAESPADEDIWRTELTRCIEQGAVRTLDYPVMTFDKKIVHYQSWPAIELGGKLRKSGYYTHWARYLNLLAQLELQVIKRGFEHIKQQTVPEHYAILLSESFILDMPVLDQFYELLKKNSALTKFIYFEVRESTVADHPNPFRQFCQLVKQFDSQIGLKRVGESFSELLDVHELGLDYVKIDSAFITDIHESKSSQSYLRGFTSMAHSFDIKVYADGVKSPEDSQTLSELGLDGEISNYELGS